MSQSRGDLSQAMVRFGQQEECSHSTSDATQLAVSTTLLCLLFFLLCLQCLCFIRHCQAFLVSCPSLVLSFSFPRVLLLCHFVQDYLRLFATLSFFFDWCFHDCQVLLTMQYFRDSHTFSSVWSPSCHVSISLSFVIH